MALPDIPCGDLAVKDSSTRVTDNNSSAGTLLERVVDVIDRAPLSALQITVITLCVLVTTIDGFDAQAIGFLAAPIAESFRADLRAFGPVFSVALFGLMLGALIMGPVGDRWGRRKALMLTVSMVGAFTLATAFALNLTQLICLRFLTGFALGGTFPGAVSLIAEYTPARHRSTAICLAAGGMPIGSMSAGICASFLLPHWGWRSMFFVGGVIPLLLAAVILLRMPESIRFLCLKRGNERNVRLILERVAPAMSLGELPTTIDTSAGRTSLFPIAELFRHGRAAVTVLLWLAYFMNLLVLYTVVSWLPALLKASGFPNSAGVTAITLFGAGGVIGSLIQGPLARRFPPHKVLACEFAVFVAFVFTLASAQLALPLVTFASFGIGWAIQGAQAGLNIYAATIYPTYIRSTGIGWGLGMGRIGSIVGPLIAGTALLAGWSSRQIFAAGAVPAILAAAAVLGSAALGISQMSGTHALSTENT